MCLFEHLRLTFFLRHFELDLTFQRRNKANFEQSDLEVFSFSPKSESMLVYQRMNTAFKECSESTVTKPFALPHKIPQFFPTIFEWKKYSGKLTGKLKICLFASFKSAS